MSRKEKRKELKKLKRKQLRREAALLSAQEVEEDEEVLIRQRREEEEALAKELAEHEEQERLWLLREEEARQEWLRKQEEEAERKRKEEERSRKGEDGEEDLEEGWEYVEDGPAEIIWQGNEIIVKKPRKKVRKGTNSGILAIEDKDRPTSNPLPPQSTAFSSYQANTQDVADQLTNFGTEQDKRNCPFYIKTGVCRFGVRCSRLHPVFNEACTLLIRSMYTGAGLSLEHVESLEVCAGIKVSMSLHTSFTSWRDGQMLRWQHEKEAAIDEEVVQEYEEFYEDVHSEFIQFGEIVNFKVCRNGSFHLRGNVYVHYLSQESALAAYNHMNGRFYAKKQISCEFVGVQKWKLAICGEFLRTYHKTCSHGSACNFLHCFENPRREYEWADLDRPPPRYWQRKMANLFGHAHISDEEFDEKQEQSRSYREATRDNGRGRYRDDRELGYDDDRRRDMHERASTREDDRGRHRDDRELVYDGDRRKSKHVRETIHEDDQRRRRGDQERKSYEDEMKDRVRRGSKNDDRNRVRHSKERDHIYDDGSARDKSASRSLHGDDQLSISEERWSAYDDYRDRRRDRHDRETTYGEEDDDIHPVRNSPVPDHDSHHRHSRSHRRRSRRRSRSSGSHRSQRSKSRDWSIQDGYHSSSDEKEDRFSKATSSCESEKERSSKEDKWHKHAVTRTLDDIHNIQVPSHNLETRADEDVHRNRKRHPSRDSWSYSDSKHQQRGKELKSDGTGNRHFKDLESTVSGLMRDDNATRSFRKLETQSDIKAGVYVENLNQDLNSTGNNTVTSSSVELFADDVQKSTSQWQTWRKTKSKKVKLGLKENPMRVII